MLHVIRENYISSEEIINVAHKQYIYWTNLAVEDIKVIIKINAPNMHAITLPRDAQIIQETFKEFCIFKDPLNFWPFEYSTAKKCLELEATFPDSSEKFKKEANTIAA
jgi:hypothetical protein